MEQDAMAKADTRLTVRLELRPMAG